MISNWYSYILEVTSLANIDPYKIIVFSDAAKRVYRMGSPPMDVSVDELIMVLAATDHTVVAIVCAGPNPISYWTQGNVILNGNKDSGDVESGRLVQFSITLLPGQAVPKLFIRANHGPTDIGIYFGTALVHKIEADIQEAIGRIRSAVYVNDMPIDPP